MLILFKVVVAAAGAPGPLLGDGTNTTVTMLLPTILTQDRDSMGARESVINSAARKHYPVSRLTIYALRGNGDNAYVGAAGSTSADMLVLAPEQGTPPMGSGLTENVNLGALDIDVAVSGNGFLVVAETL